MSTLFKEAPYQKRTKATRTQLFRRVWNSLERAERPDVLGFLSAFRVRMNPAYAKLLETAGLDTVTGVYQTELGKLISPGSRKNDVLRIELADGDRQRIFYVKRYWSRSFQKIWRRAFRGAWVGRSIVRREYENMEILGELGIRIPSLVAYGEQRFLGGVTNSFIITEEIPKAMGVDFVVGGWMDQQPKEVRIAGKSALIAEAARCLKLMHGHGFEHHDLFLRNMMISDMDMRALYILDCPFAHVWPQFIMRFRRVHDLATLDAAASAFLRASQRMRFLHAYLGCSRLSAKDKVLVREILKYAAPMRARQVLRLERSIPVDEDGNILTD